MKKQLKEYQIKFEGNVKEELLYQIGAKKIANITQTDRYYSQNIKNLNKNTLRIRDDNKGINITLRNIKKRKKSINREYKNLNLNDKNIREYIEKNNFKYVCEITKSRSIYQIGDIVINVDKVDHLGNYVEFQYHSNISYRTIINLAQTLNLNKSKIEMLTYLELYINFYRNKFYRLVHIFQKKIQNYSYAIISSLIIYFGLIFGIGLTTKNKIALISSLLAILASDSLSDAIAKYTECKSNELSSKRSLKLALNQSIVKIFVGILFLTPFLINQSQQITTNSLITVFIYTFIIITIIGIQISKIEFSNKYFTIIKYIVLIISVAFVSFLLNKIFEILIK